MWGDTRATLSQQTVAVWPHVIGKRTSCAPRSLAYRGSGGVLVLRELRALQEGSGREMRCAGGCRSRGAGGGFRKSWKGVPTKTVPKQSQGGCLQVDRWERGQGVSRQEHVCSGLGKLPGLWSSKGKLARDEAGQVGGMWPIKQRQLHQTHSSVGGCKSKKYRLNSQKSRTLIKQVLSLWLKMPTYKALLVLKWCVFIIIPSVFVFFSLSLWCWVAISLWQSPSFIVAATG